MLFSSNVFIFFFLPAVLLAYRAVPKAWKNHVLLAASLLFYFCGEPVYVLLLVGILLFSQKGVTAEFIYSGF